ncbi:WD40 repeat-like protein [Punctularia strigosozonata HHB-11173 SS5]|uniref:WD40 repeat-like protein n=1 Tax=Punctularia strigosozonata (strain HHB-11173) TaxID=741275 RepID=UPI000441832D|nr:WD40 repeat-like protein [Punctularia strigosozonata HHB-11173 SS5]EIN13740.1 WD40 repeat-like protein [Punctularia strigosozonata HHB-11173 SS5]
MLSYDTNWPADSAEFCPSPRDETRHIFAVGTYKLEQTHESAASVEPPLQPRKQQRHGRCLVYEALHGLECRKLQEIAMPAILDMKWLHNSISSLEMLAICDAEGSTSLYKWNNVEKRLEMAQAIRCASSDVLCLSLDWSNRRTPSSMGNLIVSLSNGELALVLPDAENCMTVAETWHAHEHEPWIAAWNYWDTNMIFSGGDDLTMRAWDIRQGFQQSIWINKRFDAGVTTIQSHPDLEHLIAVGSYDDKVQLFDVRKPLRALTEVNVGGGAWRVKWHPAPTRKHDLLVACMHDGFKVVRFIGDGDINTDATYEIIKRFDAHESLAYGVDWSFAGEDEQGQTLIASASFYDHRLHLWKG